MVDARESNLVNALSSKVAGVQVISSSGNPGASANIVIRGRTSLNENSPLFIIDGVPVDNSFAGSNFTDQSNRAIDINPDDIETINVLKGGAATALYGVRAANGAILITTKKGRKGGGISFSQSVTFDQVNKLPEQQQRFAQGALSGGAPVYLGPGSPTVLGAHASIPCATTGTRTTATAALGVLWGRATLPPRTAGWCPLTTWTTSSILA